jgi:hypothetical protein
MMAETNSERRYYPVAFGLQIKINPDLTRAIRVTEPRPFGYFQFATPEEAMVYAEQEFVREKPGTVPGIRLAPLEEEELRDPYILTTERGAGTPATARHNRDVIGQNTILRLYRLIRPGHEQDRGPDLALIGIRDELG